MVARVEEKKRQDLAERLASARGDRPEGVKSWRQNRKEKGGGSTNKGKKKTKNFLMALKSKQVNGKDKKKMSMKLGSKIKNRQDQKKQKSMKHN